jgi:hypothetical protein
MSKQIIIKLTKASPRTGPFNISDNLGNVLGTNISKRELASGVSYLVDNAVTVVTIESLGKCKKTLNFPIGTITTLQQVFVQFTQPRVACLWRHLTDIRIYNEFYGNTEPYIIEYPFAFQFKDEILQGVVDYTKTFKYLPNGTGVFSDTDKIEIDNAWFNKAVLYNGQQCSGILQLVPKPINNLKDYLKYPIYNSDSKTITYTKSDNFYQYNTFWSLVKNKSIPLFLTSCESLSIDKVVNQTNMDYGKRSFKKEPLRAKDLKIRHILDNRSDIHLVSQFIVAQHQISYK